MNLSALGFIGIYAFGLFLAFFRHPVFGIYAYLWAFYLHPPSRWWGENLPDLRWSLMAALVTLVATVRMPKSVGLPWSTSWGVRLLIAYTTWMWIQTAWAVNSSLHLEGCMLFTKYIILFYIIYRIVVDTKTFELFSWGHIIGCFIFGWIAHGMTVSGRLDSVGGPGMDDANLLGMHQITGLAFAGFFFIGFYSKKRWIALVTIPFILNTIILTMSRGAFLGMIGAGLIALLFSPRGKRFIIYGVIFLGVTLFFRLTNDQFWERMNTLKTTEESQMEASQRSRFDIARYGLEMVKDYPFGAGYRGHAELSVHYMPANLLSGGRRSAHNTFMAAFVEQGYPGAILYIAFQMWIWLSLFHLRSLDKENRFPNLSIYRAALATAFAACFVCSQFINALNAEIQIWLIALLAVLKDLYHRSILQK